MWISSNERTNKSETKQKKRQPEWGALLETLRQKLYNYPFIILQMINVYKYIRQVRLSHIRTHIHTDGMGVQMLTLVCFDAYGDWLFLSHFQRVPCIYIYMANGHTRWNANQTINTIFNELWENSTSSTIPILTSWVVRSIEKLQKLPSKSMHRIHHRRNIGANV